MVWFASLITRHLTLTIPIAMVLGFAYGMLLDAAPLKMLILPLTFLMVYPMMINLKIAKVFDAGGGKVQLMTQFLNFAVIPFVALGLGYFFFGDQPYLISRVTAANQRHDHLVYRVIQGQYGSRN